jgi:pimeloyl-ACP methyl ester carboxylesterase
MPAVNARPVLEVGAPGGVVRGVALVLHGGRAKSTEPVRATQLAVLRMTPFATALQRAGRRHGLAVAKLRYVLRGWNGAARSPVPDVQWALDQLAARFPDAPTALVGHSMGGRAAIYTADQPSVRAVIGLAPWIEPGDPDEQVAGRHVLVAHGDLDRTTSAAASEAWTHRARRVAASAAFLTIHRERHAMLRRAALWHALTTSYALAVLCGVPPEHTSDPRVATVVTQVLAGEPSLVV